MKVRCECIDSNGNSWPDCSCAHGWLDVPDQPIDWRARAETAERQRDEQAAALATALHRLSCPLSVCKECDAFRIYDQPSKILASRLAAERKAGAVEILDILIDKNNLFPKHVREWAEAKRGEGV